VRPKPPPNHHCRSARRSRTTATNQTPVEGGGVTREVGLEEKGVVDLVGVARLDPPSNRLHDCLLDADRLKSSAPARRRRNGGRRRRRPGGPAMKRRPAIPAVDPRMPCRCGAPQGRVEGRGGFVGDPSSHPMPGLHLRIGLVQHSRHVPEGRRQDPVDRHLGRTPGDGWGGGRRNGAWGHVVMRHRPRHPGATPLHEVGELGPVASSRGGGSNSDRTWRTISAARCSAVTLPASFQVS
jgi:hypothetical protein